MPTDPIKPGMAPKPAEPVAAAPAVHTDKKSKSEEFTRKRMKELEQQAAEAETLQGQKRLQALADIRAQIRELRRREAHTIPGANINTPRGNLLNADEAIAIRPEFHYRLVNVRSQGRGEAVQAMGYERVPEEEGGKEIGELVLFRTPLERRAARVGQQDRLTKARLQKVTEDLKDEVKEMARFLAKKGVDIDPERLGIFRTDGDEEI